MIEIIELFRPHACGKNLLEVSRLKDKTVALYLDMVYKYTGYAKQFLNIDHLTSKTWHIHKWMYHLKIKDKAYNFMKDAKVSLKRFFAFAVKAGYVEKNPAEALPRVRILKSDLNKPLKTEVLFTLLKSFDRTKWMGIIH